MELREVFGHTLVELGKVDDRVIVLDADLFTSTKTEYFKSAFPSRFVQCGVAEQNMFGVAAGIARSGLIPFPTTFSVFAAERACDQIRVSIAYTRLNVKIPGTYAGYSVGKAGATHQAIEDIAIMRAMPNMMVLAPGDARELRAVMAAILEYEGPVYFRIHRGEVADIFHEGYEFQWDKARLLRPGSDVSLVGTGIMTANCLQAAEMLAAEGIEARVLHVVSVKPIDRDALSQAAEQTGAIVTAENHTVIGGLGGAVAEVLAETHPVPMARVGFRDTFLESASDPDLVRAYGLSPQHIVAAAKEVLLRKGG